MEAYLVLGVMVLMIIAFVMNKWPFGLITMSCCIILGVAGVLDPATTFSGFCNPFVVMLAGAFVVTNALAKTSFIHGLQNKIMQMQNGKSGIKLMLIFALAIVVLATFMPGPALLAIIIMMARNLNDNGEVNAARVILPAAVLTTLWNGRIPFGIGAGQFAILNGFLESAGEGYSVGMFDPMMAGLIPGILMILYTIFCYKLLPHKKSDIVVSEEPKQKGHAQPQMSKRDEVITYVTFVVMLFFMVFNQITGSLLYIGPALCAVFLVFAKVITVEDVKQGITVDLIFMLAGIFTLTSALTSTGAGEMIGHAIISLFGGEMTQFSLVAVFAGVAIVVTNFMSNNATMYSLIPVAVTTAMAAGLNPIPAVLAIDVVVKCACVLPCSSGEAAMCYGASGYTIKDTWKFTIPATIIFYVGTLIGVAIFF